MSEEKIVYILYIKILLPEFLAFSSFTEQCAVIPMTLLEALESSKYRLNNSVSHYSNILSGIRLGERYA